MDGMRQLAVCVSSWLPLMERIALGEMTTFRGGGQRESIQKTVVMGSMELGSGQAYPERVGPFCGSL